MKLSFKESSSQEKSLEFEARIVLIQQLQDDCSDGDESDPALASTLGDVYEKVLHESNDSNPSKRRFIADFTMCSRAGALHRVVFGCTLH